ncbi:LON peptidase substrate-binding domain-containing protein [Prochlorococcus marinus]|uniref:ATP-dependent protease La (LON) domain n=1 Tax=Prochlorococcus marinus (strain MIT 9211) TaxID=93059 RepID=A9BCJ8_PROM4|nr:LON peptidase substrate-binding domain-containing protein [Prochlorococcus marinus]ABX09560.1 ATP-dependent protease La (LON) domain [Prochlorococcus marinus str. MIT 9211]
MSDLAVRELPLFPLPEVVLFPQEVLPLHIFESRYRMMLKSVLETDSRFGVVRFDPHTKRMSEVGCCAEIIKHQTSEDGRSNIITLGQQRFRVLELTRKAPFYTALVSWIDDSQVESQEDLKQLSDRVLLALKDVVSLTGKLTDSDRTLPEGLPEMPRELSFWVAAHLGGPVADEQQHLLEMQDTTNRLLREYEMLDHTRKQLAARTALKETLKNTDQANT